MMSNDFEEAFGNFLERNEYDEAQNALFDMVRIAFLAGWKAAGGEPPVPQKIFQIIECQGQKEETGFSDPEAEGTPQKPL